MNIHVDNSLTGVVLDNFETVRRKASSLRDCDLLHSPKNFWGKK